MARSESARNFRAITTVYSYLPPEIRELISEIAREYPHAVFLRSVSPGLDDFHEPIIGKLVVSHADDIPHLRGFQFRYPISGSEEGIREFMTVLQTRGVKQIYMLQGDYEGYREVARTREIHTVEVAIDVNPRHLERGYWFISNPSARNGVHLPDGFIYYVCEAGHKVFYDLSYLGTTEPYVYNLSHPNIVAAAISFSKPYGLFYYRIGFMFSRENVPSLYANKWFKNIFSLIIAERVLEKLDLKKFASKYKALQREIIERIFEESGLCLRPSEAFLLAHLHENEVRGLSTETIQLLQRFKRAEWYRFCL